MHKKGVGRKIVGKDTIFRRTLSHVGSTSFFRCHDIDSGIMSGITTYPDACVLHQELSVENDLTLTLSDIYSQRMLHGIGDCVGSNARSLMPLVIFREQRQE